MIRVSGTVFNTADTKKITPVTDAEVIVYSCRTVAQGRKLQKELYAIDRRTEREHVYSGKYIRTAADDGQ